MKKIISMLMIVVMVLSLCSVNVFAEANWESLENYINIQADSEYVEEVIKIGIGGITSDTELKGYNLIADGSEITVTNSADSDCYKMYVGLEPFVKTDDGSYVSDGWLQDESYVQYNFTTDGRLVEAGAIGKFADSDYKILSKGESFSFTLPESLSYNIYDRPYGFFNLEGKEVIWLVSVYAGYSENNDYMELQESERGLFWCYKEGAKSSGVEKPITTTGFSDVKESDYYSDAVKWTVDNGITKGTSETTFSPEKVCTHAEILTFLWRASGEEIINTSLDKFKGLQNLGISESDYFVNAYKWAYDNGVIGGTITTVGSDPTARESETTIEVPIYKPTEFCSRMNTVNYLFNTLGKEVMELDTWSAKDFTDVSGHDMAVVAWAIDNGITKGTSETTFSPNDTCTRGQIVTFLYRAFANR